MVMCYGEPYKCSKFGDFFTLTFDFSSYFRIYFFLLLESYWSDNVA